MLKRTIRGAKQFAEEFGDTLRVTIEITPAQLVERGQQTWLIANYWLHQSKILECTPTHHKMDKEVRPMG